MADVIRDVVVRIRMQIDKSDDLRKAAEQAVGRQAEQAQMESVRKVSRAKKEAGDAAVRSHQQEVEAIRKKAQIESDLAVKLDRIREQREQRKAAARAREIEQARQEAAAASGGGGAGGAAGKGFFGGGTENKALAVASAVITVANAPKVILGNISQLIRDLRSGEFAKPGQEFFAEVGGASRDLRSGGEVGRFLQGFLDTATFGLLGFGERQQDLRNRQILGGRGGIIRNGQDARVTERQRADMDFEALQKQVAAQRELNGIILERTQAERDLLTEQRKRIEFAKEEFGLLDARKKQDVIALAEKVGRQGVGALTPEELDFARQNQAFRGILGDQARAAADAQGFDRVIKALGIDKQIADREAKIQAELKQFNQINLDPTKLAQQLEEQMAPLLKQLQTQMEQRLRVELDRQNKARQNLQGAGF